MILPDFSTFLPPAACSFLFSFLFLALTSGHYMWPIQDPASISLTACRHFIGDIHFHSFFPAIARKRAGIADRNKLTLIKCAPTWKLDCVATIHRKGSSTYYIIELVSKILADDRQIVLTLHSSFDSRNCLTLSKSASAINYGWSPLNLASNQNDFHTATVTFMFRVSFTAQLRQTFKNFYSFASSYQGW